MPAIEGGSRVRGDIERTHRFPARRVDRVQRVAGRDPDIGAVIAHPMHLRDIRKGGVSRMIVAAVRFMRSFLLARQRGGE